MRVLVIGSGGREHAICHAFKRSPRLEKLFCAPGNAGIAQIAECVAIKADDITALADFATRESIDLTFVGGEGPLALGVVDEFESRRLRIIGASRSAARLEASKAFAKDFMSRHGIPTAKYHTANSPAAAIEILESGHFGDAHSPVVVKADGLAAGKGVVVARDRAEAKAACGELAELVGADAAEKIVLEEFLEGREVSLIMFADGEDFALMPPVRDHKRIGEGNTGPNTGGMGTITDSSLLSAEELQTIIADVIGPTLAGCIKEGFPFRGILFLGLMIANESATPHVREAADQQTYITAVPKVLEYNVRFGDPETQSILVRLESDLIEICDAMLAGAASVRASSAANDGVASPTVHQGAASLKDIEIVWRSGNSACVVLAAEGYPSKPRTGDVIDGLEDAAAVGNVTIFHAGTTLSDGGGRMKDEGGRMKDEWKNEVETMKSDGETMKDELRESRSSPSSFIPHPSSFVTAGGRVLGVTATGNTLDEALSTAYTAAAKISWPGMQYRRDIGK